VVDETFCDFDDDANELREQFTDFITHLPQLRTLEVSGMGARLNLSRILARHGSTLQSLTLHEFEWPCTFGCNETLRRPYMSYEEISLIRMLAPKIKHLAIDLPRTSEDWPQAHLDALKSLPNLEYLAIDFDLMNLKQQGHVDSQDLSAFQNDESCFTKKLQEPVMNNIVALDIFRGLRSKTDSPFTLKELTITVGDAKRWYSRDCVINSNQDVPPMTKIMCMGTDTGEKCLEAHMPWETAFDKNV
jgi:hypothetical protein